MKALIIGEKISNKRKYASNPASFSFFLVNSKTTIWVMNLNAKITSTHGQRKRKDNRTMNEA
jgi:hypothetical protein